MTLVESGNKSAKRSKKILRRHQGIVFARFGVNKHLLCKSRLSSSQSVTGRVWSVRRECRTCAQHVTTVGSTMVPDPANVSIAFGSFILPETDTETETQKDAKINYTEPSHPSQCSMNTFTQSYTQLIFAGSLEAAYWLLSLGLNILFQLAFLC